MPRTIGKIKPSGVCKKCKRKRDAEYRKNNKEKIAKYFYDRWRSDPEARAKNLEYKEIRRTGMNATEFVQDKSCEVCGLTNKEHMEKYGERLHIHHRDNNGRHHIRTGLKPEHENLQVLCRSCHVSIDNANRDYTGRGHKSWETRRANERNRNQMHGDRLPEHQAD